MAGCEPRIDVIVKMHKTSVGGGGGADVNQELNLL